MRLRDILRAFGFHTVLGVEREFTTDLGAPKAIVRVPPDTSLFVGSLNGERAKAPLEQLLPTLNEVGARLASRSADVQLGSYYRAQSGEYVIVDGPYYRFVTTAFDGREATPKTDGQLMARALGLLHQVGADVARTHPAWTEPRGNTRDALKYFVLPQLAPASVGSMASPEGCLTSVRARLAWLLDHRADDIDRLPLTYAHTDFQPKNVLVCERSHLPPRVRVIDAESGAWQTRLYDLYFLLSGDDSGPRLGDLRFFAENAQAYVQTGGPLTSEEERLLPSVLQCKGAMIAAWAVRAYPQSSPEKQAILQACFETALRCISEIGDRSAEIRAAARGR